MLIQPPQTPNIDRSSHQNSSSSGKKRSSNFPFLLSILLPFKKLVSISIPHRPFCFLIKWSTRLWQNSPIGLEGASHLLFAACCRAEEENKAETEVILEEVLEVNVNDNYIRFLLEDSKSDKNGSFSKDKDNNYWEDVADGSQNRTLSSLINISKTPKAKEKLIRILAKDILISKDCWSL